MPVTQNCLNKTLDYLSLLNYEFLDEQESKIINFFKSALIKKNKNKNN